MPKSRKQKKISKKIVKTPMKKRNQKKRNYKEFIKGHKNQ